MSRECPQIRVPTCYKCSQEGHVAKDCPAAQVNGGGAGTANMTCYACGKVGQSQDLFLALKLTFGVLFVSRRVTCSATAQPTLLVLGLLLPTAPASFATVAFSSDTRRATAWLLCRGIRTARLVADSRLGPRSVVLRPQALAPARLSL